MNHGSYEREVLSKIPLISIYAYFDQITTLCKCNTSDGTEEFVRELKNEDFPTFGRPTIPIFKLFDGRPNRGFSTVEFFLGGMFVN